MQLFISSLIIGIGFAPFTICEGAASWRVGDMRFEFPRPSRFIERPGSHMRLCPPLPLEGVEGDGLVPRFACAASDRVWTLMNSACGSMISWTSLGGALSRRQRACRQ